MAAGWGEAWNGKARSAYKLRGGNEGVGVWKRTLYSQLLQHLEFTLHLRRSVGIVPKTVYEDLQEMGTHQAPSLPPTDADGMGLSPASPAPAHLDVLAVLLLGLILALLIEEPLLLAFDKGFKVPPVTV